jgi:hypothetical protein
MYYYDSVILPRLGLHLSQHPAGPKPRRQTTGSNMGGLLEALFGLRFLGGEFLALSAFVLVGCLHAERGRRGKLEEGQMGSRTLHSIAHSGLTTYGGLLLAPLMAGRPPEVLTDDILVPLLLLCWYLVHQRPGIVVRLIAGLPVLHQLLVVLAEAYRARILCRWVSIAAAQPHLPAVASILIGATAACGNAFFPLDRGLRPLRSGLTWPMQSAIYASIFYFYMARDEGPVGVWSRRLIVGTSLTESAACASVSLFFGATAVVQTLLSPKFNPLSPVNLILDSILRVGRLRGRRRVKWIWHKEMRDDRADRGLALETHTRVRFVLEQISLTGAVALSCLNQLVNEGGRDAWYEFWLAVMEGSASQRALLVSLFSMAWHGGYEICLTVFALMGSMKVRRWATWEREGDIGWLEGLVFVTFTTFGGISLAALFLHQSPPPLVDDLIIPIVIVTWFAVNRPKFANAASSVMALPAIHHILVILAEIFRANALGTFVDAAARDGLELRAVFAGVLAACGGMFMPLDRGLNTIATGLPWAVQSSLWGAALYRIVTSGWVGFVLAPAAARALLAIFFGGVSIVQASRGPHFNPFSPIYSVLYMLTGLQRPSENIRGIMGEQLAPPDPGLHGLRMAALVAFTLIGVFTMWFVASRRVWPYSNWNSAAAMPSCSHPRQPSVSLSAMDDWTTIPNVERDLPLCAEEGGAPQLEGHSADPGLSAAAEAMRHRLEELSSDLREVKARAEMSGAEVSFVAVAAGVLDPLLQLATHPDELQPVSEAGIINEDILSHISQTELDLAERTVAAAVAAVDASMAASEHRMERVGAWTAQLDFVQSRMDAAGAHLAELEAARQTVQAFLDARIDSTDPAASLDDAAAAVREATTAAEFYVEAEANRLNALRRIEDMDAILDELAGRAREAGIVAGELDRTQQTLREMQHEVAAYDASANWPVRHGSSEFGIRELERAVDGAVSITEMRIKEANGLLEMDITALDFLFERLRGASSLVTDAGVNVGALEDAWHVLLNFRDKIAQPSEGTTGHEAFLDDVVRVVENAVETAESEVVQDKLLTMESSLDFTISRADHVGSCTDALITARKLVLAALEAGNALQSGSGFPGSSRTSSLVEIVQVVNEAIAGAESEISRIHLLSISDRLDFAVSVAKASGMSGDQLVPLLDVSAEIRDIKEVSPLRGEEDLAEIETRATEVISFVGGLLAEKQLKAMLVRLDSATFRAEAASLDTSGLASVRRTVSAISDGVKPIHVEWSENPLLAELTNPVDDAIHTSETLITENFLQLLTTRLDAATSRAESAGVKMEALNTVKRLISEVPLHPIASLGSQDSSLEDLAEMVDEAIAATDSDAAQDVLRTLIDGVHVCALKAAEAGVSAEVLVSMQRAIAEAVDHRSRAGAPLSVHDLAEIEREAQSALISTEIDIRDSALAIMMDKLQDTRARAVACNIAIDELTLADQIVSEALDEKVLLTQGMMLEEMHAMVAEAVASAETAIARDFLGPLVQRLDISISRAENAGISSEPLLSIRRGITEASAGEAPCAADAARIDSVESFAEIGNIVDTAITVSEADVADNMLAALKSRLDYTALRAEAMGVSTAKLAAASRSLPVALGHERGAAGAMFVDESASDRFAAIVDEAIASAEADITREVLRSLGFRLDSAVAVAEAAMISSDGLLAIRNLVSSAENYHLSGGSVMASEFGLDNLSEMEHMVDGAIAASELAIAHGVLGAMLIRLDHAAYQTEVAGVSTDELAAARRAVSELMEQWVLAAAASSALPPLDRLVDAIDAVAAASETLEVSGALLKKSDSEVVCDELTSAKLILSGLFGNGADLLREKSSSPLVGLWEVGKVLDDALDALDSSLVVHDTVGLGDKVALEFAEAALARLDAAQARADIFSVNVHRMTAARHSVLSIRDGVASGNSNWIPRDSTIEGILAVSGKLVDEIVADTELKVSAELDRLAALKASQHFEAEIDAAMAQALAESIDTTRVEAARQKVLFFRSTYLTSVSTWMESRTAARVFLSELALDVHVAVSAIGMRIDGLAKAESLQDMLLKLDVAASHIESTHTSIPDLDTARSALQRLTSSPAALSTASLNLGPRMEIYTSRISTAIDEALMDINSHIGQGVGQPAPGLDLDVIIRDLHALIDASFDSGAGTVREDVSALNNLSWLDRPSGMLMGLYTKEEIVDPVQLQVLLEAAISLGNEVNVSVPEALVARGALSPNASNSDLSGSGLTKIVSTAIAATHDAVREEVGHALSTIGELSVTLKEAKDRSLRAGLEVPTISDAEMALEAAKKAVGGVTPDGSLLPLSLGERCQYAIDRVEAAVTEVGAATGAQRAQAEYLSALEELENKLEAASSDAAMVGIRYSCIEEADTALALLRANVLQGRSVPNGGGGPASEQYQHVSVLVNDAVLCVERTVAVSDLHGAAEESVHFLTSQMKEAAVLAEQTGRGADYVVATEETLKLALGGISTATGGSDHASMIELRTTIAEVAFAAMSRALSTEDQSAYDACVSLGGILNASLGVLDAIEITSAVDGRMVEVRELASVINVLADPEMEVSTEAFKSAANSLASLVGSIEQKTLELSWSDIESQYQHISRRFHVTQGRLVGLGYFDDIVEEAGAAIARLEDIVGSDFKSQESLLAWSASFALAEVKVLAAEAAVVSANEAQSKFSALQTFLLDVNLSANTVDQEAKSIRMSSACLDDLRWPDLTQVNPFSESALVEAHGAVQSTKRKVEQCSMRIRSLKQLDVLSAQLDAAAILGHGGTAIVDAIEDARTSLSSAVSLIQESDSAEVAHDAVEEAKDALMMVLREAYSPVAIEKKLPPPHSRNTPSERPRSAFTKNELGEVSQGISLKISEKLIEPLQGHPTLAVKVSKLLSSATSIFLSPEERLVRKNSLLAKNADKRLHEAALTLDMASWAAQWDLEQVSAARSVTKMHVQAASDALVLARSLSDNDALAYDEAVKIAVRLVSDAKYSFNAALHAASKSFNEREKVLRQVEKLSLKVQAVKEKAKLAGNSSDELELAEVEIGKLRAAVNAPLESWIKDGKIKAASEKFLHETEKHAKKAIASVQRSFRETKRNRTPAILQEIQPVKDLPGGDEGVGAQVDSILVESDGIPDRPGDFGAGPSELQNVDVMDTLSTLTNRVLTLTVSTPPPLFLTKLATKAAVDAVASLQAQMGHTASNVSHHELRTKLLQATSVVSAAEALSMTDPGTKYGARKILDLLSQKLIELSQEAETAGALTLIAIPLSEARRSLALALAIEHGKSEGSDASLLDATVAADHAIEAAAFATVTSITTQEEKQPAESSFSFVTEQLSVDSTAEVKHAEISDALPAVGEVLEATKVLASVRAAVSSTRLASGEFDILRFSDALLNEESLSVISPGSKQGAQKLLALLSRDLDLVTREAETAGTVALVSETLGVAQRSLQSAEVVLHSYSEEPGDIFIETLLSAVAGAADAVESASSATAHSISSIFTARAQKIAVRKIIGFLLEQLSSASSLGEEILSQNELHILAPFHEVREALNESDAVWAAENILRHLMPALLDAGEMVHRAVVSHVTTAETSSATVTEVVHSLSAKLLSTFAHLPSSPSALAHAPTIENIVLEIGQAIALRDTENAEDYRVAVEKAVISASVASEVVARTSASAIDVEEAGISMQLESLESRMVAVAQIPPSLHLVRRATETAAHMLASAQARVSSNDFSSDESKRNLLAVFNAVSEAETLSEINPGTTMGAQMLLSVLSQDFESLTWEAEATGSFELVTESLDVAKKSLDSALVVLDTFNEDNVEALHIAVAAADDAIELAKLATAHSASLLVTAGAQKVAVGNILSLLTEELASASNPDEETFLPNEPDIVASASLIREALDESDAAWAADNLAQRIVPSLLDAGLLVQRAVASLVETAPAAVGRGEVHELSDKLLATVAHLSSGSSVLPAAMAEKIVLKIGQAAALRDTGNMEEYRDAVENAVQSVGVAMDNPAIVSERTSEVDEGGVNMQLQSLESRMVAVAQNPPSLHLVRRVTERAIDALTSFPPTLSSVQGASDESVHGLLTVSNAVSEAETLSQVNPGSRQGAQMLLSVLTRDLDSLTREAEAAGRLAVMSESLDVAERSLQSALVVLNSYSEEQGDANIEALLFAVAAADEATEAARAGSAHSAPLALTASSEKTVVAGIVRFLIEELARVSKLEEKTLLQNEPGIFASISVVRRALDESDSVWAAADILRGLMATLLGIGKSVQRAFASYSDPSAVPSTAEADYSFQLVSALARLSSHFPAAPRNSIHEDIHNVMLEIGQAALLRNADNLLEFAAAVDKAVSSAILISETVPQGSALASPAGIDSDEAIARLVSLDYRMENLAQTLSSLYLMRVAFGAAVDALTSVRDILASEEPIPGMLESQLSLASELVLNAESLALADPETELGRQKWFSLLSEKLVSLSKEAELAGALTLVGESLPHAQTLLQTALKEEARCMEDPLDDCSSTLAAAVTAVDTAIESVGKSIALSLPTIFLAQQEKRGVEAVLTYLEGQFTSVRDLEVSPTGESDEEVFFSTIRESLGLDDATWAIDDTLQSIMPVIAKAGRAVHAAMHPAPVAGEELVAQWLSGDIQESFTQMLSLFAELDSTALSLSIPALKDAVLDMGEAREHFAAGRDEEYEEALSDAHLSTLRAMERLNKSVTSVATVESRLEDAAKKAVKLEATMASIRRDSVGVRDASDALDSADEALSSVHAFLHRGSELLLEIPVEDAEITLSELISRADDAVMHASAVASIPNDVQRSARDRLDTLSQELMAISADAASVGASNLVDTSVLSAMQALEFAYAVTESPEGEEDPINSIAAAISMVEEAVASTRASSSSARELLTSSKRDKQVALKMLRTLEAELADAAARTNKLNRVDDLGALGQAMAALDPVRDALLKSDDLWASQNISESVSAALQDAQAMIENFMRSVSEQLNSRAIHQGSRILENMNAKLRQLRGLVVGDEISAALSEVAMLSAEHDVEAALRAMNSGVEADFKLTIAKAMQSLNHAGNTVSESRTLVREANKQREQVARELASLESRMAKAGGLSARLKVSHKAIEEASLALSALRMAIAEDALLHLGTAGADVTSWFAMEQSRASGSVSAAESLLQSEARVEARAQKYLNRLTKRLRSITNDAAKSGIMSWVGHSIAAAEHALQIFDWTGPLELGLVEYEAILSSALAAAAEAVDAASTSVASAKSSIAALRREKKIVRKELLTLEAKLSVGQDEHRFREGSESSLEAAWQSLVPIREALEAEDGFWVENNISEFIPPLMSHAVELVREVVGSPVSVSSSAFRQGSRKLEDLFNTLQQLQHRVTSSATWAALSEATLNSAAQELEMAEKAMQLGNEADFIVALGTTIESVALAGETVSRSKILVSAAEKRKKNAAGHLASLDAKMAVADVSTFILPETREKSAQAAEALSVLRAVIGKDIVTLVESAGSDVDHWFVAEQSQAATAVSDVESLLRSESKSKARAQKKLDHLSKKLRSLAQASAAMGTIAWVDDSISSAQQAVRDAYLEEEFDGSLSQYEAALEFAHDLASDAVDAATSSVASAQSAIASLQREKMSIRKQLSSLEAGIYEAWEHGAGERRTEGSETEVDMIAEGALAALVPVRAALEENDALWLMHDVSKEVADMLAHAQVHMNGVIAASDSARARGQAYEQLSHIADTLQSLATQISEDGITAALSDAAITNAQESFERAQEVAKQVNFSSEDLMAALESACEAAGQAQEQVASSMALSAAIAKKRQETEALLDNLESQMASLPDASAFDAAMAKDAAVQALSSLRTALRGGNLQEMDAQELFSAEISRASETVAQAVDLSRAEANAKSSALMRLTRLSDMLDSVSQDLHKTGALMLAQEAISSARDSIATALAIECPAGRCTVQDYESALDRTLQRAGDAMEGAHAAALTAQTAAKAAKKDKKAARRKLSALDRSARHLGGTGVRDAEVALKLESIRAEVELDDPAWIARHAGSTAVRDLIAQAEAEIELALQDEVALKLKMKDEERAAELQAQASRTLSLLSERLQFLASEATEDEVAAPEWTAWMARAGASLASAEAAVDLGGDFASAIEAASEAVEAAEKGRTSLRTSAAQARREISAARWQLKSFTSRLEVAATAAKACGVPDEDLPYLDGDLLFTLAEDMLSDPASVHSWSGGTAEMVEDLLLRTEAAVSSFVEATKQAASDAIRAKKRAAKREREKRAHDRRHSRRQAGHSSEKSVLEGAITALRPGQELTSSAYLINSCSLTAGNGTAADAMEWCDPHTFFVDSADGALVLGRGMSPEDAADLGVVWSFPVSHPHLHPHTGGGMAAAPGNETEECDDCRVVLNRNGHVGVKEGQRGYLWESDNRRLGLRDRFSDLSVQITHEGSLAIVQEGQVRFRFRPRREDDDKPIEGGGWHVDRMVLQKVLGVLSIGAYYAGWALITLLLA